MNEQIIPGSKMMKVTGILMIISGALSIISSLVVKGATTLLLLLSAAYEPGGDLEKASGKIGSAYTIFILLGIVVLAVGIIATVQAKKTGQSDRGHRVVRAGGHSHNCCQHCAGHRSERSHRCRS